MPDLPDDWRERMVDLVSGAVPPDGALFAGGPVLGPLEQIGLYRTQYRLRLVEAVRDDLIGLVHHRGQEHLDRWILAFLEAHPSTSWTLNRLSLPFPDWLADQPDSTVIDVELARLDRAVQRGFEAADGVPLALHDLTTVPALALAPHVQLLAQTTNAYAVRGALLADQAPPTVIHQPAWVVLHRRERRMRHWAMEEAPFRVLEGLAAGRSVLEAVGAVVEAGLVAPDAVQAAVAGWFQGFAEEDLLVRQS